MLTMLNNRAFDNAVLKYAIYGLLTYFVFWIIRYSYKIKPDFFKNRSVVVLFILLITNLIFSPYNPLYVRIIKYLGYLGCFVFGYILCEKNIDLKCNKWFLWALVFVPIICVGLLYNTPHKTLFFKLSNGFSYYGLCASLLIYTIYNKKDQIFKWSIMLILIYIASASTLGIVSAIVLSILIINRHNVKLMFITLLLGVIGLMCILYIDLPIFLRIRDVFNLAGTLTWYDWTHLKDLNLYQLESQVDSLSGRSDNTSFIWRLAHWQKVLDGFINNWWYAIPFGLGDGYSVNECGNYCHNEYLKFFAENGLVVFMILIKWVNKAHLLLCNNKAYYFILAIFCYHLTENLIDSFVPCAMFYFCLGYWIMRVKALRHKLILANIDD